MQENLSLGVCKQQRRKQACTSAQAGQGICSTFWKDSYQNLLHEYVTILATLWSWGDWFGYDLVWNSDDRLVSDKAHTIFNLNYW